MPKSISRGFAIALFLLAILLGGRWIALGPGFQPASLPGISQPATSLVTVNGADLSPMPLVATTDEEATATCPSPAPGPTVTQSFTLEPGWNSLYLEVDPLNDSAWINQGTDGDPLCTQELSTMEAVLADLPGLESVWTWNTPQSTWDYIVDPAEGLWDAPGWLHYFPSGSVDENGDSLAFLTNLLSLHPQTAYLVKLADDAVSPVTLTVSGTPTVRRKRWTAQSYNLSGFPIQPGSTPAVADFLAGSAITQTLALSAEGVWEPTTALAHGQAYMVYYGETPTNGEVPFAAPTMIEDPVADGLQFRAGTGGNQIGFTLSNRSPNPAAVTFSLLPGNSPGGGEVALRITDPITQDLRLADGAMPMAPAGSQGSVQSILFTVLSREQIRDGEAILQITTNQGVRWQLPVTARSGSLAGLWVGDVTVNQVSEGRLGSANVADGALTVSLRSRNGSGLSGSAHMQSLSGQNSTALTLTLDLPGHEILPLEPIVGEAPLIGGYVFEDANQNGQRDGDEAGLAGVKISLSGTANTATTGENGRYLFTGLISGTYAISATSPAGYTADFPVTLPITTAATTNTLPTDVVLDGEGILDIKPDAYRAQTLYFLGAPYALPTYADGTTRRVDPQVNFGLVTRYSASLWKTGGGCANLLTTPGPTDLGEVVNGSLNTRLDTLTLDDLLSSSYAIVVQAPGATGSEEIRSCGEIEVAAPTANPLTFRMILRVAEDGSAALLPRYVYSDGLAISAVTMSIQKPVTATQGVGAFGDSARPLEFTIRVESNDPLNPFKHKYHPDHDNLTRQFLPFPDTVQPYQLEAPQVTRRLQLELTDDLRGIPDFAGLSAAEAAALAAEVDWGGGVWGGRYSETLQGLHKNDITVKGYFILRHVATASQLTEQTDE